VNGISSADTARPGLVWPMDGSWPEVIYGVVALVMLSGFALILVLAAFDARTIDGHVSVWAKPLKFCLSLAVHAGTLALVCSLLSPPHRQGPAMLSVAIAFLAACTVEMGYIVWQAAHAEHSHFNVGTPFHRMMYSVMAFAAVIIVGAAGAVGLAVLADGGFAVLTLVTAFAIGGRMSPFVGGVPDFGARMALTGWSRSGGDLRVSHFLATHMIQAVPVFSLLAGRTLPGQTASAAVIVLAMVWSLLTLSEFRTALAGSPSVIARALP
jgi:hypothetical protein